jgi:hypothetical protein
MTTLTIKINPRSKKGKAFLAFTKSFVTNDKDIEIIENEDIENKSPYNPEFVAKIKKAEAEIKKGNTTRLNPNDIWGSIL